MICQTDFPSQSTVLELVHDLWVVMELEGIYGHRLTANDFGEGEENQGFATNTQEPIKLGSKSMSESSLAKRRLPGSG